MIKLWIVVMVIMVGDVVATAHAPWQVATVWALGATLAAGIYIGIRAERMDQARRNRTQEQDEMFRDGGWS